jgi:hypothetical protein
MKPLKRKELAEFYGYNCTKTFTRKLAAVPVPVTPRELIRVETQIAIYAHLGIPPLLPLEMQATFLPLVKQYCEQHELSHTY